MTFTYKTLTLDEKMKCLEAEANLWRRDVKPNPALAGLTPEQERAWLFRQREDIRKARGLPEGTDTTDIEHDDACAKRNVK